MTASERLAALDAEMTEPPWRRGPGPKNTDELAALRNALPEIVAVMKAAEDFHYVNLIAAGVYGEGERLRAALAALNEKLGQE